MSANAENGERGTVRLRTRGALTGKLAPIVRKPVEKHYGAKSTYGETKHERERRERRERNA